VIQIDTGALINLLLGHSLYSDELSPLRELIQNAVDACRVRKELSAKASPAVAYAPEIRIVIEPESRATIIKDNGVGMTEDIIHKYLLRIGSSYYQSPDFVAQGFSFQPFGRYGIGFLSAFRYSDTIWVRTMHVSDTKGYSIEFRKNDSFGILKVLDDLGFYGTEVVLRMDPLSIAGGKSSLIKFLQTFSSHEIDFRLMIRRTEEIQILDTIEADLLIDVEALTSSIRRMRLEGSIDEFANVARNYVRCLSNRDLVRFDEKYLKVMLLTLFRLAGIYVVQTEVETDRGYIDILLTRGVQQPDAVKFEWLIELKYLRASEQHTLAEVRREGLAQLQRYAASYQIQHSYKNNTLRKVLLTFMGKDRLYVDQLAPIQAVQRTADAAR
jgi:hypothetical protein